MKPPLTVTVLSNSVKIQESDGSVVASFPTSEVATANELMRIVNAHEPMVEAMEKAISTIEGLADQQAMPDPFYLHPLAEIRNTLALAKEPQL